MLDDLDSLLEDLNDNGGGGNKPKQGNSSKIDIDDLDELMNDLNKDSGRSTQSQSSRDLSNELDDLLDGLSSTHDEPPPKPVKQPVKQSAPVKQPTKQPVKQSVSNELDELDMLVGDLDSGSSSKSNTFNNDTLDELDDLMNGLDTPPPTKTPQKNSVVLIGNKQSSPTTQKQSFGGGDDLDDLLQDMDNLSNKPPPRTSNVPQNRNTQVNKPPPQQQQSFGGGDDLDDLLSDMDNLTTQPKSSNNTFQQNRPSQVSKPPSQQQQSFGGGGGDDLDDLLSDMDNIGTNQRPSQQNFQNQRPSQQNFQNQRPSQQNFQQQRPSQQNFQNQRPSQQNFQQQNPPQQQNFQNQRPSQQNFQQQRPSQQNFQQQRPSQQNFGGGGGGYNQQNFGAGGDELDDLLNDMNSSPNQNRNSFKPQGFQQNPRPMNQNQMNQNQSGPSRGVCAGCNQQIFGQVLQALGKAWHPEHFVCGNCKGELGTASFYEQEGKPHCENCYQQLFCPRCAACDQPIVARVITALGKKWHPEHFVCTVCNVSFGSGSFYERGGYPYCQEHYYNSNSAAKCASCNNNIVGDVINAIGQQWHPNCFVCQYCHKAFTSGQFYEMNGLPYCEIHYFSSTGAMCGACNKAITGKAVNALGKSWHPEHFVCALCFNPIVGGNYTEKDQKAYCNECNSRLFY